MIIQGNNLNYNYMQQMQTQQTKTTSAGSAGSANSGISTRIAPKAKADSSAVKDRIDAFGDLMGKYLQGFTDEEGNAKDSSELVNSLKSTVRWVEGNFGKDAATATMGMVVQSASSSSSEEGIGNGLLNALKMVDRNFGFAAGDQAIATFNSGVNRKLNDFFDNGSMETFVAAETTGEGANVSSRFFIQSVQQAEQQTEEVDPNEALLESMQEDLEEIGAVNSLKQELDEETAPASMQQALAAYSQTPAQEPVLFEAMV